MPEPRYWVKEISRLPRGSDDDQVPTYEEAIAAPHETITTTSLAIPGSTSSGDVSRRRSISSRLKGFFGGSSSGGGGGSSSSSTGGGNHSSGKDKRHSTNPDDRIRLPCTITPGPGFAIVTTTSPPPPRAPPSPLPPTRASATIPPDGASDAALSALAAYDTVFIIDDSPSMHECTSTHTSSSHWDQARKVLASLVDICAGFDSNGIDVYFMNAMLGKITARNPRTGRMEIDHFEAKNVSKSEVVMDLFRRREKAGLKGSTPTAEALDAVIRPYLAECTASSNASTTGGTSGAAGGGGGGKSSFLSNPFSSSSTKPPRFPKPLNILLITDGASNNNPLLVRNLTSYAHTLDALHAPPNQLGIQFFQVGNMLGVAEFLSYLDNALCEERGVRDMIDTKSSEEMGPAGLTGRRILTTVLGAVNRRLDVEMDWEAMGLVRPAGK